MRIKIEKLDVGHWVGYLVGFEKKRNGFILLFHTEND